MSIATAIGPLIAAFIVQYSPGKWVDYMWVCAALAGANLVAIYLLYPESNFVRSGAPLHTIRLDSLPRGDPEAEKATTVRTETINRQYIKTVPKPWLSIWTSIITVNDDAGFFQIFLRPFKTLLSPSILFAVFVYGTSLAAQIILMYVTIQSLVLQSRPDSILVSLFQVYSSRHHTCSHLLE